MLTAKKRDQRDYKNSDKNRLVNNFFDNVIILHLQFLNHYAKRKILYIF